jgi:class 3 adenylate cyclase
MIEMKRPKIKKTVRKKIQSGKKLVKRTKNDTSNKDYAEMLFSSDEKTLDSETLIKVAQKRVSDSIVTGIEYSPFRDNSEEFLRDHVNSRVHIFVMYIDLVNSTNITLSLPEEKVVKLITSFAQEMAYTVTQFGGYMLKFVGDAVLAYFNADNALVYPADNIVNCAKSMIRVLNEAINPVLNENDYPTISAKIGIDAGENMIVRYGSDKTKSHVDILGASMNMAAKIQNMAEPNEILIGGDVYARLHPETQKAFNKKILDNSKWKYHNRKTGKIYPIYVYSTD